MQGNRKKFLKKLPSNFIELFLPLTLIEFEKTESVDKISTQQKCSKRVTLSN